MTSFTGFPSDAFAFYAGLEADNSKAYWSANKHRYEQAVRQPVTALLDELASQFGGEPRVFRPYRDIRFSADKSPYKTHQGGFLELAEGIGYYVSVDAAGVTVGGGFHAHTREQTARYRAAVDQDTSGRRLASLVARLEQDGFTIGGDQVKTRPRGVPADHPRLDLMRRAFLTATRDVSPADASRAGFGPAVEESWHRLRPLIQWQLTHIAHTTPPAPNTPGAHR